MQKGNPNSSKGGRTKYKMKTEAKDLGMETHPGKGVVKEEKFPYNREPSHRCVCGELWNLRGQPNQWLGGGTTECMPNHNHQWRSGSDACVHHQ